MSSQWKQLFAASTANRVRRSERGLCTWVERRRAQSLVVSLCRRPRPRASGISSNAATRTVQELNYILIVGASKRKMTSIRAAESFGCALASCSVVCRCISLRRVGAREFWQLRLTTTYPFCLSQRLRTHSPADRIECA